MQPAHATTGRRSRASPIPMQTWERQIGQLNGTRGRGVRCAGRRVVVGHGRRRERHRSLRRRPSGTPPLSILDDLCCGRRWALPAIRAGVIGPARRGARVVDGAPASPVRSFISPATGQRVAVPADTRQELDSMNVLGCEQGLGRRSGKRRPAILARARGLDCGRGHVPARAVVTAWPPCAARHRTRNCQRQIIAVALRRRSAVSASRATSRLLRKRESQRERLEGHGRFRAAQRSRDTGPRHRAGEGLQLANVVLRPGNRGAASPAGAGGRRALGSTGHGLNRSDGSEGYILIERCARGGPLHTWRPVSRRSSRERMMSLGDARTMRQGL